MLGPIEMNEEVVMLSAELRMLLLLMTIVVFAIFIIGRRVGAKKAYMLLFIYLLFILYVIGRSTGHEFTMKVASFLRFLVELMPFSGAGG